MKLNRKTLVILSGGMDSTTLLYKAIKERRQVQAISFNYGQRHKIELERARGTCRKVGVSHRIIDLSFYRDVASNSALTGDIAVPHGHYQAENMKLTVVPNRNAVMSNIAIGYAVNRDLDEIALGVHTGDHAIYPDCRPIFIKTLRKMARIANFKPIKVWTPFLYWDKGDIAILGKKLKVDYKTTQSCYEGGEKPCGLCGSCTERAEAFKKAGVKDPLLQ